MVRQFSVYMNKSRFNIISCWQWADIFLVFSEPSFQKHRALKSWWGMKLQIFNRKITDAQNCNFALNSPKFGTFGQ